MFGKFPGGLKVAEHGLVEGFTVRVNNPVGLPHPDPYTVML